MNIGKQFLKKEVQRISQKKLINAIIVLVIIIGFLYVFGINIFNLYGKGIEFRNYIDVSENFNKGKYYINDKEALIVGDSGFYYNDPTVNYYLATLYDRGSHIYVLYRTKDQLPESTYENYFHMKGRLRKASSEDIEIYNNVYKEISLYDYDINIERTFVVDGDATPLWNQMIVTSVLILGVITIIYIVFQFIQIKNYKTARIVKKILLINHLTIEELETLLDENMNEIPYIEKKDIYVSSYLIYSKKMYSFKIRQTKDLMWAYRGITSHYLNDILTSNSYALHLYFSNKKNDCIVSQQSGTDYNDEINTISTKIPTVICGYSDELKEMYTNQFSEFITMWNEYKENNHLTLKTNEIRKGIPL